MSRPMQSPPPAPKSEPKAVEQKPPERRLLAFALHETPKGTWEAVVFKIVGKSIAGEKVISSDTYRRQPETDLEDSMRAYYVGGIPPGEW